MPSKLIIAVVLLTCICVLKTAGFDLPAYRVFCSFPLCDYLDNRCQASAMVRKLNVGPFTAENRVRFQTSLCGVCFGQSGAGTDPPAPKTLTFACQYHLTFKNRASYI